MHQKDKLASVMDHEVGALVQLEPVRVVTNVDTVVQII